MNAQNHMRFHAPHAHLASPFGPGTFGKFAETTARFLGTPMYLIGQTGIVILWVALNATGVISWDVYPFILLNLGFSLQAAYAAPMILLAETRQADRDKTWTEADAQHRQQLAETTLQLLQQNTDLTQQIEKLLEQNTELTRQVDDVSRQVRDLTVQIHGQVVKP
jgi:uncharacterized membrane protein